MKRRLFNLAAAVSLVLIGAIVALWVRSYFVADAIARRNLQLFNDGSATASAAFGHRYQHWSAVIFEEPRGGVSYDWEHTSPPSEHWGKQFPNGPVAKSLLGFFYAHRRHEEFGDMWQFGAPLWAAGLLVATSLILWSRSSMHERRRRLPPFACTQCGYDLRATPDRCPECGMSVATKPAEAAA